MVVLIVFLKCACTIHVFLVLLARRRVAYDVFCLPAVKSPCMGLYFEKTLALSKVNGDMSDLCTVLHSYFSFCAFVVTFEILGAAIKSV